MPHIQITAHPATGLTTGKALPIVSVYAFQGIWTSEVNNVLDVPTISPAAMSVPPKLRAILVCRGMPLMGQELVIAHQDFW